MREFVPKKIFFTKGVGTHKDELHSFERALRDAGIEKYNLVQVSSIFPPSCKMISRSQGLKELVPGSITYCVMSRCCSNEPKRLLAAPSAARFRRTRRRTVISASIIPSDRRKSRRAITRKISRRPCWHPLSASILMLMRAGMKRRKYSRSAARSSERAT